jgi:hypothetical protein
MADEVTLVGDLMVYNEEFQTGYMEGVLRNTQIFNESTSYALTFKTNFQKGDLEKQAFWTEIDAISRRDNTQQNNVDAIKLGQSEVNKIKLYRRFGPVAMTLTAFKDIGDPNGSATFGFMMGQKYAEQKLVDFIDTAFIAFKGATQSDPKFELRSDTLMDTETILDAISMLGDKSSQLTTIVMHSKVWFQLVKQQLQDYQLIAPVGQGILIYGGGPASFGRVVVVTDSPALENIDGVTGEVKHTTLLLTKNAVEIQDTGGDILAGDMIIGKENIQYNIQGEYDFFLGVKNFEYLVQTGGKNPDDATLSTGVNWLFKRSDGDVKAGPGIKIVTQTVPPITT